MVGRAQIEDVRFTSFIYTEPQHYILSDNKDALIHVKSADGFNIGAGFEYQSNIVYAKATTYYFPDLKGITYFDLGGGFGFNYQSRMRYWRLYTGFVAGRIWRGGEGDYAYMGGEAGIDYYFNGYMGGGFFVGIQGNITSSTDSKHYSDEESITRKNLGLKVGFTF